MLAAGGEEGLEEGGGFVGEDAGEDFDAVIEARVGEDFETGANGAAFGVVGTVDEARYAGLNHGAGAHGAGFEGDIERGSSQAVVGKDACGFAKNDDFGVSGGIVVANCAVTGASDDFIFVNEDSADGNFTGFGGGAGFVERELHVVEIGRHLNCPEE